MKQKESESSFFTEESVQPHFENKQPQQFKALFLKNIRLQSKQIGTNLCQILTPILCILFTYAMQTIAKDNMPVGAIFDPIYYPVKFNDYDYFDQVNQYERNRLKWITYSCTQQCDEDMLGFNNGQDRTGVLGQIPFEDNGTVDFHPNAMDDQTNIVEMEVPFFLKSNSTSVNSMLYSRLEIISNTDIDLLKDRGGLDYLPDGAYDITRLSNQNLTFDLKVNDVRDLEMHRENGVSRIGLLKKLKGRNTYTYSKEYNPYTGIMELAHMLTAAFIQTNTNSTVGGGYYHMPEDSDSVSFVDTIISFVAVLVFPISLSLLFPVFLYTVVLEKEQKLIQMMKMNGMKISSYWIVYFMFNLMLSFFTNLIFVGLGYFLTGLSFFVQTSGLLLFLTLLGWSLAQIGLAVFFQTFLSKARSANIIGYLISIWTSMIGATLSIGVYQYPTEMPYGCRMFAPFGFVRIIYLMLTGCSEGRCFGSISHIPSEMVDCLIYLYISFFFFFFLGTYLFEIVPQEFGVTRSALFPFKMVVQFFRECCSGKNDIEVEDQLQEDEELKEYIGKDEEDPFSKNQRSAILSTKNLIKDHPLVINNLRKLYKKEGREGLYPAVRSFNLKVGTKQTFGLLGPNGAGKTTLISMITGMFEPNNGNAWIGGYDIRTRVQKAQLQMGVCPQFDLLWPQLTVEEHLYFYARLKGIPSSSIAKKVQKALQEVKLVKFKTFPSSSLSGGMKRRLSVAISLVGDPKIVFLDEPSTGLDPDNRRQLWDVLAKCQKNRAILITTHMMEEADALCNRIGIITSGVLRTVGSQTSLKKVYGGGYRLTVSTVKDERKLVDRQSLHMLDGDGGIEEMNEEYDAMEDEQARRSIDSFILAQERQKQRKIQHRVEEVTKFMNKHFEGTKLVKQFNGYLIFKVSLRYKVSEIFEIMQKMQKQLDIVDVAITNSSLEDVFMNVVKQYDSQKRSSFHGEGDNNFVSFPQIDYEGVENEELKTKKESQDDKYGSVISKKRESVMSQNLHEPKEDKKGADDRESGDYF